MDDANLSKLCVKNYQIEPQFNKDTTNYTLTVSSSVESIEIEAVTNDRSASYFIKYQDKDGNTCRLKDGTNKIIIEVSSEDGTIKLYNIICQKLSASEAYIKSLAISSGVKLEPIFDKNVFEYKAIVDYDQTSVTIDAQVDDPKCEIKLVYNLKEHVKAVNLNLNIELNYGISKFDLLAKSPDGSKTQAYTITIHKRFMPRFIKFKNLNDTLLYEDSISLAPLFCASKLYNINHVYSEPFIEYFYNQSKQDFLSGSYLKLEDSNKWMSYAYDVEANLSTCEASVPAINGENSDVKPLRELGEICANLAKSDQIKFQTPIQPVLEYDSNLTDTIHKYETNRAWEKALVKIYDETDPQKLMAASENHLQKYFSLRDSHVPYKTYEKDNSPLDYLNLSIITCATALKYKNNEHEIHFQLAMLLEEKHILEDMYGFKSEDDEGGNDDFSLASNKKAKESSKEEEINAICKLRNVAANASVELKLKALDEEYHSLLQSGQTHKAEQVQLLYLFKVQQTKMDASTSTKVGDNQKPLGQAYVKYLDALSLTESAKLTKYLYHFHVGRMYCLRSNFSLAIKHLTICLQWTSEEFQNLVRFYLGYALSFEKLVLKTRYEEAAYYLCLGLQTFLSKISTKADDNKPKLFAQNLYSLTNIALLQGFINIASIVASHKITKFSLISAKDALHYCAWLSCLALNTISLKTAESVKTIIKTSESIKQISWLLVRSHSNLLDILSASVNNITSSNKQSLNKQLLEKRCFYLSALLRNINKDNNFEILNLQERICQKLVLLNASDSYFLYLLANSQLEKYDFEEIYNKNDDNKLILEECKNTLLASIQMEDKLATGEPLTLVTEQKWWIEAKKPPVEATQSVEEPKKPDEVAPDNATNKQTNAKPGAKPAAGKPASNASKTAPVKPADKKPVAAPAKTTTPANKKAVIPAKPEVECKHNTSKSTQNVAPSTQPVPVQPQTVAEVVKPASATKEKSEPVIPKMNQKLPATRLLLARVYVRLEDIQNAKNYYNQVIDMDPNNHDAYIEMADVLKLKGDPLGAVDVYTKFKTGNTPTFDDAYIFGEIISILMKHEKYDDQRLVKYMVLWGKVLGIGVLDKYIKKLDEKNKTKICKEIYCGVHDKKPDDPELQNFFKFKGWI